MTKNELRCPWEHKNYEKEYNALKEIKDYPITDIQIDFIMELYYKKLLSIWYCDGFNSEIVEDDIEGGYRSLLKNYIRYDIASNIISDALNGLHPYINLGEIRYPNGGEDDPLRERWEQANNLGHWAEGHWYSHTYDIEPDYD